MFHRLFFPCGFAVMVSLAAHGEGGGGAAAPKTFEDFEKSTAAGTAVPAGLSEPLQALWHAKAKQWDRAHEIAQEIKTPTGSWIHALLHREEGDRANAGYWYRRAGMTMPEGFTIAEEWSFIARELWQREHWTVPGKETLTSPGGLVATCTKSADGAEGASDTLIRKDGKQVLRIPNARPVSFNPAGDVLLLIEAAADDDCRHFLIKPVAGAEIPPFGGRRRIGGRFVTGHKWSEDGRSVTLVSGKPADDGKEETIPVDEHMSSK
jgi:hypothetical protein